MASTVTRRGTLLMTNTQLGGFSPFRGNHRASDFHDGDRAFGRSEGCNENSHLFEYRDYSGAPAVVRGREIHIARGRNIRGTPTLIAVSFGYAKTVKGATLGAAKNGDLLLRRRNALGEVHGDCLRRSGRRRGHWRGGNRVSDCRVNAPSHNSHFEHRWGGFRDRNRRDIMYMWGIRGNSPAHNGCWRRNLRRLGRPTP